MERGLAVLFLSPATRFQRVAESTSFSAICYASMLPQIMLLKVEVDLLPNIFQSPRTAKELVLDSSGSFLIDADRTERWPIVGGVVDFIEQTESDQFGEMIRQGNYAQINWKRWQQDFAKNNLPDFAERLASRSGVILEVASGPGGGFMPGTVLRNPSAQVIAFDRSIMVLQDWHEILSGAGLDKAVTLAAFDAGCMAIRSSSVDTVSNLVGISNTECEAAAVLEIVRVLKPGGYVYSEEIVFSQKDWCRLPEDFRARVERGNRFLTEGLAPSLINARFEIVENSFGDEYLSNPEGSGKRFVRKPIQILSRIGGVA